MALKMSVFLVVFGDVDNYLTDISIDNKLKLRQDNTKSEKEDYV
jgi:hypothetical protein